MGDIIPVAILDGSLARLLVFNLDDYFQIFNFGVVRQSWDVVNTEIFSWNISQLTGVGIVKMMVWRSGGIVIHPGWVHGNFVDDTMFCKHI